MDILVTGASGNVGGALFRQQTLEHHRLFAGTSSGTFVDPNMDALLVDFARGVGPERTFDAIFLMRPPHLTDPVPFRRFLERYDRSTRIVFLSVQGAEDKGYLPHAKIEAAIRDLGFDHCFVRPSYFMENLLTTLAEELEKSGRIYLPAGRLALDWISVDDVAACVAAALTGKADRSAISVCSGSMMTFTEALNIVNHEAGTCFRYEPASLPGFIKHELRRGRSWGTIAVALLLHFLPRFLHDKDCRSDVLDVLGRKPETFSNWAERYRVRLRELEHGRLSKE